jgi:threonine dehydrogenase-like Zn-dependent dehydrogenase
MGAVASIEVLKPVDASDISQTGSLGAARAEVMRLRDRLGHLAKQAGFADVVYDASDLVLGVKESEDFDRCIAEIVHIRSALRLATQSQRRQTRSALSGVNTAALEAEAARRRAAEAQEDAQEDDRSSSSSSESEDN